MTTPQTTKVNGNGNKGSKPAAAVAATESAPVKEIDKVAVKALFQKVFAFQKTIKEREAGLKEERKQASGLLKAILDATNNDHGPYVLAGVKYTIVSRTLKGSDETTYHLRSPLEHEGHEL